MDQGGAQATLTIPCEMSVLAAVMALEPFRQNGTSGSDNVTRPKVGNALRLKSSLLVIA